MKINTFTRSLFYTVLSYVGLCVTYWITVQLQATYCAPLRLRALITTLFTSPSPICGGLAQLAYTTSSATTNILHAGFTGLVAFLLALSTTATAEPPVVPAHSGST